MKTIDTMGARWGEAPIPLLPASVRKAWREQVLPTWLADELQLPRDSTFEWLNGRAWQRTSKASTRVLDALVAVFRQRQQDMLSLPCCQTLTAPPSVSLLERAPFSTRSRNSLQNSNLLNQPTELLTATFKDLLSIPALGHRSALEIACVLEAIGGVQTALASEGSASGSTANSQSWIKVLADATEHAWIDQVSENDPRFAPLLPIGHGTLQERIEQCLADPASVVSATAGAALAASLGTIRQEIARIESLRLDEALVDLLKRCTRNSENQFTALLGRFGWDGRAPKTLEDAAKPLGVTRERVRQIEERFIERLPQQPLFLPQLDAALSTLEQASPIPFAQAECLLSEKAISSKPFSIEALIRAARVLRRITDLEITDLARGQIVMAGPKATIARHAFRTARKLAGMAGVGSVFQVARMLTEAGSELEPHDVRRLLIGIKHVEFLNDDWFWVTDIPIRRNRLSTVSKKILSVASPQSVRTIRDGVRRAYSFRSKSNTRYESLSTPPSEVVAEFFRHSPEFRLTEEQVGSVHPLDYRTELGEVEQAFVDALRGAPNGVLDRKGIVDACQTRGLNENSVGLFLTYSPIIEHIGTDIWKLRGVRVDPAAIEAMREANESAPRERRLLDFGWRSDGKLWIAFRIPHSIAGLVLSVPGGVKRFLADRIFRAVDPAGRSFGQITIGESGSSFGYAPFLRASGADAGDVLLAQFDLPKEFVELSLADEVVLGDELSAA